MNVKRICNYHSGDFDRLEKYEKDNLVEHHHLRIKVLPELASEDKLA